MKIICIGRNYAAHAAELGNEIPEEPVIFMKPKSALLTNNTPFYYPDFTNELHYECEIVLKVIKNGKYITEQAAPAYFNAISLGIDFTARDVQDVCKKKGLPWEKAKAFDNSAVVGSFSDYKEFARQPSIHFTFLKNNEVVQTGDTANMMFSFNSIISHISNYFSLNIGDLIFTGTPAGVGECVVGDILEAKLEGKSVFSLEIK